MRSDVRRPPSLAGPMRVAFLLPLNVPRPHTHLRFANLVVCSTPAVRGFASTDLVRYLRSIPSRRSPLTSSLSFRLHAQKPMVLRAVADASGSVLVVKYFLTCPSTTVSRIPIEN